MLSTQFIAPAVFAVLAVVFAVLAYRDYRRNPGVRTPARKTRTRIAVIFAMVSVGLLIFHGVP